MITKKEMGYVNDWPNKIPYPGDDYCAQTLEKLKKCFELYNNEYLNRRYTIQFSNNEEVDFAIEDKNLAHILGVDYKNLMKDIFMNYRKNILDIDYTQQVSSYMLLCKVIDNIENILEYDKQYSACRGLNYYRIGIKCDIFSKLTNLSDFNYGCINFNKDIYNRENTNRTLASQSSKFLYTPSDEVISPYFMMGIRTDNNDSKYIAETLLACSNPKSFFVSQEVIIPTQILTDDNGYLNKRIATSNEKIKLLKEYQNIVNQYNIPNMINIYGDYYSMLMAQKEDNPTPVLKR